MLSLNTRVDGFKFRFPKEFIVDELKEKYGKILAQHNSFIHDPIEFLNETVKSVSVLGFNDATVTQQQTFRGLKSVKDNFMHTSTDVTYRSEVNPIQLLDKTFVVTFRHTLGYLNYFLFFENFFHLYARETEGESLVEQFNVDLFDQNGQVFSRIVMFKPIIDGIENLNFDYAQPVASNSEFKVTFKYSNIDYQFIELEENDYGGTF